MDATRTLVGLSLLLAAVATAQQTPPTTSTNSSTSEPQLPVIEYDACPSKGRTVPEWRIRRDSPVYSSVQLPRTQVGNLKAGETVTVLSGADVTREPDRILVTRPFRTIRLAPGDIILRYGYLGEGVANIWAKGVWHREYDLGRTTEKDGKAGCLAQQECDSRVIEEGVKEYWVRVKTNGGLTGWTLASKVTRGRFWDSGNFDSLCAG
jgi:hypothetical protein